jgi:hypothetical protein
MRIRWMTAAIVLVLPAFSWITSATGGTCTVAPAVVAMETDYTITATGLRPNASHGVTIRQSGKGSYTKGIGSHPNAGLETDAAGAGSATLTAHGIDTYTDPRLVLNPDAGTVQVHIELASFEPGGGSTANCSFELTGSGWRNNP